MTRIVAAMMLVLTLAGCDGFIGEIVRPPIAVVNPDYLVFRPVTKTPTPGAASGVVYEQTLYYQPADRLLDLTHLDLRTATLEDNLGPEGTSVITIATTPAGSQVLHDWTSKHVGQQLGIFVDGRLISAPFIQSAITDMIVVDGDFTKPQAEAVLARLCRGGA